MNFVGFSVIRVSQGSVSQGRQSYCQKFRGLVFLEHGVATYVRCGGMST